MRRLEFHISKVMNELSYHLSSASVPILLRKQTLGLVLPLCAGEATPRFAIFFRDRLVVGARERVST